MLQWMFSAVIALGGFGFMANASELDHESKMINVGDRPADLPATLVIRVSDKTKLVEVAHLKQEVIGKNLPADTQFTAIKDGEKYAANKFQGSAKSELDQERGQESWFFYYGGYYNPMYWYGGYSYAYAPYYNYWYGGYSYYYYRPYYYYPCWC